MSVNIFNCNYIASDTFNNKIPNIDDILSDHSSSIVFFINGFLK